MRLITMPYYTTSWTPKKLHVLTPKLGELPNVKGREAGVEIFFKERSDCPEKNTTPNPLTLYATQQD
jgi:hypothetical protein